MKTFGLILHTGRQYVIDLYVHGARRDTRGDFNACIGQGRVLLFMLLLLFRCTSAPTFMYLYYT